MSSNHGRPRSATPFRTPPRSQVVPHGFTSMSFKSESRPTWAWRPSRQGFFGRFRVGILLNDGFFLIFKLLYSLVIFEMIFGWFNDDFWWFISSYKIAICDFGDDFWDDFSLQKLFGISLTMCWNHRHPRSEDVLWIVPGLPCRNVKLSLRLVRRKLRGSDFNFKA